MATFLRTPTFRTTLPFVINVPSKSVSASFCASYSKRSENEARIRSLYAQLLPHRTRGDGRFQKIVPLASSGEATETEMPQEPEVQSDKPSTVDLSYVNKNGRFFRSILNESTGSNRPTSGSIGQNIEMKRGDWSCPRCSFMNFATNSECLECKESRPKRLLTGSEWECPQCDFLNYGKNTVCLRCNCNHPGGGFSHVDHSNSWSNKNRLSENEDKAQSWFTKLSNLESTSDANSSITGENFPDIKSLHDGVGKVVTDSQYKTKSRLDGFSGSKFPLDKSCDKGRLNVTHHLDEIVRGSVGAGSSRSRSKNEVRQNVGIDNRSQYQAPNSSSVYGNMEEVYDEQGDRQSGRYETFEGRLHDLKDHSGAIADDDFPDIMPMRKGENRIVVSKKKDRSLTSPLYKRRTAMEQSGNNYVPFVPFPPDYFARDKQPVEGSSPPFVVPSTRNHSSHGNQDHYGDNLNLNTDNQKSDSLNWKQDQPTANQQDIGWNSSGFGVMTDGGAGTSASRLQNNVNQVQSFVPAQQNTLPDPMDSSHGTGNPNGAKLSGSLSQSTQKQSLVEPLWKGRSLEGSAVKESDPLDMSEEAKTERFFKRVAQIKDIKELSEIPDEDFPSIMPMRKGVNRFVISKRKTPLERRLAQSQYRRNQPPVTTDSVKQEDEQREN